MKGTSQADLEYCFPDQDVVSLLDFCLKHLYADDTTYVGDRVVHNLSFEELIGTLRKARQEIIEWREDADRQMDRLNEELWG